MARPLRVEFEGAWYHGINRGAGRRPIFNTQTHREIFLELLNQISLIYSIEIHAYCLMRNHYHLLLRTPKAGLGRAMRHLNGVYAQRFNRLSKTDGPLFKGRYKAILVDADAYLKQLSRYIHLNPFIDGMVQCPAAYPHSSYAAYLGLKPAEPWLLTSTCLSLFGGDDVREEYRKFVEAGLDEETRAFYSRERLAPVFGRASFKEEIRTRLEVNSNCDNPEIPDARQVRRFDLREVARAVCIAFGVSERGLRGAAQEARKGNGMARGAFTHLARKEGGHSLMAIAQWLEYRTYAGPSMAMARFRDALEVEPALIRRLEATRRILYEVKT